MEELLKNFPDALTISDVSAILNITPATVRRHIETQDIPCIKIGKIVRIPKSWLYGCLCEGKKIEEQPDSESQPSNEEHNENIENSYENNESQPVNENGGWF